MLGAVLLAIAVGILAFIIAAIVGAILHLGALVAYAGLIGVVVAIIWFFTHGPGTPVV